MSRQGELFLGVILANGFFLLHEPRLITAVGIILGVIGLFINSLFGDD